MVRNEIFRKLSCLLKNIIVTGNLCLESCIDRRRASEVLTLVTDFPAITRFENETIGAVGNSQNNDISIQKTGKSHLLFYRNLKELG